MLRLSGTLDIDAEGRPTGEVAIRAQNWPEMLAMAERAGLLPPGCANGRKRAWLFGGVVGAARRP
jgi:Uncharacterized protein conserved in bacteria (DUF2125).